MSENMDKIFSGKRRKLTSYNSRILADDEL
jgi:hypothetical protein